MRLAFRKRFVPALVQHALALRISQHQIRDGHLLELPHFVREPGGIGKQPGFGKVVRGKVLERGSFIPLALLREGNLRGAFQRLGPRHGGERARVRLSRRVRRRRASLAERSVRGDVVPGTLASQVCETFNRGEVFFWVVHSCLVAEPVTAPRPFPKLAVETGRTQVPTAFPEVGVTAAAVGLGVVRFSVRSKRRSGDDRIPVVVLLVIHQTELRVVSRRVGAFWRRAVQPAANL